MAFNAGLAQQFADRVLAGDEGNVAAVVLKARIHQARNEPMEALRFAEVAAILDPGQLGKETALVAWLDAQGCRVDGLGKHEAKLPIIKLMQPVSPASVVEESEEEAAALPCVMLAEDDEADADDDDAAAGALVVLADADEEKGDDDGVLCHAVPQECPPPLRGPAERRMALPKASAAVVAIAIHAALILLLGLIVVVAPTQPVAELVGIVAPETSQEQPETKKVTPVAMQTSVAVVGSPARAITASGISAISLPDFDSKADGPIVTEIATTDLGASFALPFTPKGTSNVNFFGIKSKGRRVAFLIDAERYMLTDPRGGYPAYEIVKNEIAGMIGKLGLDTFFNVILYEGRNLSAFSEKLLPATAANKAKVADWLYPVNREFTKLGLQAIKYPIQQLTAEIEPVSSNYLSGYLRAIQYALELDVDAVFVISSGYRSMEVPRTPEERAKLLKQMKWTEKDDVAWREAIKKGQDWLNKENAARRAKGVPERVIVNIGEVWRDMGFRPPRSPPGGIQISAEEREDQIKNAIRLHYQSKDKPKPQINFVIFIGKDQDEKTVPRLDHFENIAQRARNGKVRVLQGLAALKNVSGK
ncbi:MAG: hypothetical protein KDK97_10450 [Verrucomicrobiales bacterium]|nr:hypothetical protein [Verrucomicrobiales bacterium]MCP5557276.1 hypothetical protein [Verrucomicrobiaceae bacterium]